MTHASITKQRDRRAVPAMLGAAAAFSPLAGGGALLPGYVVRHEVHAEGYSRLLKHDYEHGWPLFEARPAAPGRPGFGGTLADLRDKTVLVRGEYGSGDNILLMRYFPLLKQHSGCKRLILEAAPGMETLYQEYFPDCEVITMPRWGVHPDEEIRLRIMSLPWLLGPAIGWHPRPPLPVPPGLVSTDRRGVGLCASTLLAVDGTRARATDYAPFVAGAVEAHGMRVRDVGSSFKNPPQHLFDRLAAEFGPFVDLRHEALGYCDWLATARTIAGLELVISVDTGVANLAGSLGIATWVLQRHADQFADWRWSDRRWFTSARVFQQPRPGDWARVFRDVADALANRDQMTNEGVIKR